MRTLTKLSLPLFLLLFFCFPSRAFEGRITISVNQGGSVTAILYTVGTNAMRVEVTGSTRPDPVNLVDLNSHELTILFPNNRSFVRLKPVATGAVPRGLPPVGTGATEAIGPTNFHGVPALPPVPQTPNLPMAPAGLPPGVGPQVGFVPSTGSLPGGPPGMAGPGMAQGMPNMPFVPMMRAGMTESVEFKATGQKTNLLGCLCERFELKSRGETLEVWATGALFPFQAYRQRQPHAVSRRDFEERWPELVQGRGLFPLLAVLRLDNGPERYRFAVESIRRERVSDTTLFQAPPDYQEIEPLPF